GSDEIVSLTGISRIDDEIPEPGIDGDHLRRHHYEPGNTRTGKEAKPAASPIPGDWMRRCGNGACIWPAIKAGKQKAWDSSLRVKSPMPAASPSPNTTKVPASRRPLSGFGTGLFCG